MMMVKIAKALMLAEVLLLPVVCIAAQERREAAQMDEHTSGQSSGQSHAQTRKRTHAEAKIIVQHSEAKRYDQTAGPALMEIEITEAFTGDIDGESSVRALQVLRDDHTARMVSMQ